VELHRRRALALARQRRLELERPRHQVRLERPEQQGLAQREPSVLQEQVLLVQALREQRD